MGRRRVNREDSLPKDTAIAPDNTRRRKQARLQDEVKNSKSNESQAKPIKQPKSEENKKIKEKPKDTQAIAKKSLDDGIEILNNQKEKQQKERQQRIKMQAPEIKKINNNRKKEIKNESKEIKNENKEIKSPKKEIIKLKDNKKEQIQVEQVLEEKEDVRYSIKPVVIIVVLLIIGVIAFLFFEVGPIIGINLQKTAVVENSNKVDIVTSPDDIYDEYMSELLVYSNHKIRTFNENSKQTWEYDLIEQFTPKIYIKDRFMAVTNNSTGNIYFFENKKEIMNTKVNGVISNLYIDNSGNFAVDYSTNEYKKVISVYNKNGKLLYNTYPSTTSIMYLELIDDAQKLLILESSSKSFKIGLNLYLIDSNANDNAPQKIATFDNNFAYDFKRIKDNLIILLDNEIVKCNINTLNLEVIKNFDSNQMLYVGLADNYYFTIEKELNSDDDNYNLQTTRFDNTQVGSLSLQVSPKMVKNNKLLNYIVYQNNIQVINKWGIDVKNILVNSNPNDIVLFGNKSIALIYTNKVYIVNL